jgi:hypothetical protein
VKTTCTVAQPIVTSDAAARTGLYGYLCSLKAAFRQASAQGQPVLFIVPQYLGATGVAVRLSFLVPVKFSRTEQRYLFSAEPSQTPATKIPNLKAMLEMPADRGGEVSRCKQSMSQQQHIQNPPQVHTLSRVVWDTFSFALSTNPLT